MSSFLLFQCYGLVQTGLLILMRGSSPETEMTCLRWSASQIHKPYLQYSQSSLPCQFLLVNEQRLTVPESPYVLKLKSEAGNYPHGSPDCVQLRS